MRKWLEYLTQNHPYYCNLPIQWQRLQEFPEYGNVSDRIQLATLQQPTRTNLYQTGGSSKQEEYARGEAEEAIASELEDTKLDSQRRMELQQKHQNVRIFFIEEYSMLDHK